MVKRYENFCFIWNHQLLWRNDLWFFTFNWSVLVNRFHLDRIRLLKFLPKSDFICNSCNRKKPLQGLQLCLDFGVKTYHIISLNPSWWISRNLDFFIRRKLNYCAIFFNLLHAISCSMMVKLLTENQYFADTAYLCKKKMKKKREKSFWRKQTLGNLQSKEWQVLFFFK